MHDDSSAGKPDAQEMAALEVLFAERRFAEVATVAQTMTVRFPLHGFGWKALGAALKQMGRGADALVSMQKAAALSPDDAAAHSNLGVALKDQGRLEDSETSCRRAVEISPNFADAHSNLGDTLLARRRLNEAEVSYRRALQIKPHYAEAQCKLGVTLTEQGRLDEASASYRRALEIEPNYAEAHCRLGDTLMEQGRLDGAEASYRRALQINPGYAQAHSNLGVTLKEQDRPYEAEASFRRALQINPDYADAHYNLGNSLLDQGRLKEAEASYRRVIGIRPDLSKAQNNLGVTLMEQGRLDEAGASYRRALEVEPDYAEARYNLSIITKYRPGDPSIAQMKELMANPNLADQDRRWLSFALGKAYDDIGDADNSFRHLLEGNRLRKKELGYDISTDKRLFAFIKSLFEADRLPTLEDAQLAGGIGRQFVFIVGMPRSGTTLVEQILASHSQVHGAGELEVLNRTMSPVFKEIQELCAGRLTAGVLKAVRDGYLAGLDRLGIAATCVTDKMPLNFRWLGFIFAAMPEAKVVHVQRDPVATCWSAFKHCFSGSGNGYACDLVDVAEYYRLYIDLMEFWRRKFPKRIYDLNYEALTEHQEEETRKLLKYCGLGWEDRCLAFDKTERAVRTASSIQVRQKMYKGSSEAWRKYESYIQPMLEALKR